MPDRPAIARLLNTLYAARQTADLDAVCAAFHPAAVFRLTSASQLSPVVVKASGRDEYRPLLALLLRTFRVSELAINAMIIDGSRAAVHWRATIHSRITGVTSRSELIDLIELRDDLIGIYTEFSVSL